MRKKLDWLGGVGAQGKGLEEGGGLTEGLGIYYLQAWHITNLIGTPVWLIMGRILRKHFPQPLRGIYRRGIQFPLRGRPDAILHELPPGVKMRKGCDKVGLKKAS